MDNAVNQASVQEGKTLAHMYDGQKDLKSVDRQVHDRLLQDAIKSHHSELNIDAVNDSLVKESNKINNKSVTITKDAAGEVHRDNNSFPGMSIVDNGKLYEPYESNKTVLADDAKREQAQQAGKKDSLPQINFTDGGMGIPTLFGQMAKASSDQNH